MRRKRANISRGMLFAWGMGIGLLFLFAVPQRTSDRIQLTYARVFRWPLAAGHGLTLAARDVALPHGVTEEQYRELLANHHEIQNVIANLQAKLRETQSQNEMLARLRAKPGWETVPIQLAPVIVGVGQEQNELIIGRGKDHGLAIGQFVMSLGEQDALRQSESVVGTITSVDARTAKVRLLTAPRDPKAPRESGIVVSIGSLSVRPLLEGSGGNKARIPLVKVDGNNIGKGDPVYVQKAQGLDVPVIAGRVTQCVRSREDPMFWDITVEPVCDVSGLREVAVVVPFVPVH
ncbi:MAG TPA: rod shape-determining protein MreC [Sedimentisphaerales bacterium]|nr:rod shape-determining protein MreC [Sedimentisphaerales bacterium]